MTDGFRTEFRAVLERFVFEAGQERARQRAEAVRGMRSMSETRRPLTAISLVWDLETATAVRDVLMHRKLDARTQQLADLAYMDLTLRIELSAVSPRADAVVGGDVVPLRGASPSTTDEVA